MRSDEQLELDSMVEILLSGDPGSIAANAEKIAIYLAALALCVQRADKLIVRTDTFQAMSANVSYCEARNAMRNL